MDQQAVTEALSEAIIKVAQREFDDLSRGLEPWQIAERISNALVELEKLSSGRGIPEYDDPWIALFYVTWYQPRQINIAYSMLKNYLDLNHMNDSGKLFIIDFGCGALAMQFGTALAFSDAAEHGKTIPSEMSILSLDSSEEMINIGCTIWEEFLDNIQTDKHLDYLVQLKYLAYTLPEDRNQLKSVAELLDKRGWNFWIGSIHTVYYENLNEVRDWLRFLADSFKPESGFITSFQGNSYFASEVSPFENNFSYTRIKVSEDLDINDEFRGYLPKITEWRRKLYHQFLEYGISNAYYLTRHVQWDTRDTNFLIYNKIEDANRSW